MIAKKTHSIVRIANPADRSRNVSVDCLVDSGAFYTMIPRSLLEKVGTKITGTRRFKLADGRMEEFPIGEAYVEVDGINLSRGIRVREFPAFARGYNARIARSSS